MPIESPPRDLLGLLDSHRNWIEFRGSRSVSVEGFVDDLEAVFDESYAIMISLLFGSGVKIKTLDALSRRLPVLSTGFGIEGSSMTNAVNCLVEDELDLYPQLMSALTDVDYNSNISREARRLYLDNYSEAQVLQEYNSLFGEGESLEEAGADINKGAR